MFNNRFQTERERDRARSIHRDCLSAYSRNKNIPDKYIYIYISQVCFRTLTLYKIALICMVLLTHNNVNTLVFYFQCILFKTKTHTLMIAGIPLQ